MKLVDKVLEFASKYRNKVVSYSVDNQILTYGEFYHLVINQSENLIKCGLLPGQRVLIDADKNINFAINYLATHLSNGIAVPINLATHKDRKERIILDCNPSFEIIGLQINKLFEIYDSQEDTGIFPETFVLGGDLLYTTGTTGNPKGVFLNHSKILSSVISINSYINISHEDTELIGLPMGHSFCLGRLRCILAVGGSIVFIDGYAQQQVLFEKIRNFQVTSLGLVPAAWQTIYALSKDKIGEFKHQIRFIEFGSSFLDDTHKMLLTNLLPNTKICMNFGLTESPRSFFQDFKADSNFMSSIGLPSPSMQVSIRNEEGNAVENLGEIGEICVKSEFLMDGYWNNLKETESAFFKDWFRTGEIGYANSNGYFFVKGRVKEIINVGGFKVAPKELEDLIIQLDGVEDVACSKVPDKITGEAVAVFIVVKNGIVISKIEIKNFLKDKIESYKLPNYIEFVSVIPRAESGKIQRQLLTLNQFN